MQVQDWPLITATVILLTAAGVAALLLSYICRFSAWRLGRYSRWLNRGKDDPAKVGKQTDDQEILVRRLNAKQREALYYEYIENVRHLTDVKLEVIRSGADTQNQLLLLHANEICNRSNYIVPVSIEMQAPDKYTLPVCIQAETGENSETRGVDNELCNSINFSQKQVQHMLAGIDDQLKVLRNRVVESGLLCT